MKTRNVLEAAEYGDPTFQLALGILHWFHGVGDEKYESAIDWLQRAAENGLAPAQHALYLALRSRDDKDPQAFQWCKMAAESGFAPAELLLGVSYQSGVDVQKDSQQAVIWVKRAADRGYTPAMHHLGLMYLDGTDVQRDVGRALQILQLSAERGDPGSAYTLGMKLIETATEASVQQGLKWIKKAASSDHHASNFLLSTVYAAGLYGTPKDEGLANLFRHRAERLQQTR
jgi:uncharacterized protein